jgi:predicted TIM-barrel fold metal-dependent hydrolase
MIIDAHVHAWAPDTVLSDGRDYTPGSAAPAETLLAQMDAHGVEAAVLVQPSFLGGDNRYLLDAMRRWPDRFGGVAVLPATASRTELEDLRAAGVTGLRLNLTYGAPPDTGDATHRRLFERAASVGLHLQVHLDGPQFPRVLRPILEAGCRVVVDHFGRPDPARGANDPGWRAVLDLAGQGEHAVKLSAPYRLAGVDPAPLARELLAAFGPERLVWGSDFPWTRFEAGRSYRQCLDWLADWVTDPGQRATILGASAATLYGFADAA